MRSISYAKKCVKENMDISFSESKFVELEILFRLAERIGQINKADKLYMILSRSDVIYERKEAFSEENFLIANARNLLKTMNQAKVYRDTLHEYTLESNKKYTFYEIEDNCLKRREPLPIIYADRILDYDSFLNIGEIKLGVKKEIANYKDTYLVKIDKNNTTYMKFENLNVSGKKEKIKFKKSGDIVASIEEIMESADELDRLEGTSYRRKILEDNIYEIKESSKIKINQIYINGVVNLAGQVGSGKSTFADALSSATVKKGYRVVMILATVDAVLKKYKLLKKLGYEICTLIGNYSRSKHIDNQMGGKDYLPEHISEILQQPCLLNALENDTTKIIKYGQEPCTILRKIKEKDKTHKSSKTTYICPYYNFCPRTENDRRIYNADIVITTLEGYCYCNFGSERKNFLEYAISNFDLIIMDEIDNVVCVLDEIFSPVLAVNKYIVKNTEYCANYQSDTYENKCRDTIGTEEVCYQISKLQSSMKLISKQVKEHQTGWSDTDLKSFSAMTLLYKIESKLENKIGKKIWKVFYNLLTPNSLKKGNIKEIELLSLITASNEAIYYMIEKISEIIEYKEGVKSEIIKEEFQKMDNRILKKLIFILNVIEFEQTYRKLSNLIESMQDIPIELREILSRIFGTQQKYMPSSPVGNVFEIEVRDDDMYIKKQFAFGRALALKMPYLILDSKGNPIGPNVLLMSGTGYMPGSERYHIDNNVNYVIEAEQEKRDYIARTKIYNLRSEHRVSGADEKFKNQNLQALIQEHEVTIKKCMKNNEKILMIVNKYEQCEVACAAVEKILRKYDLDVNVRFLKSDSEDIKYNSSDNGLQRRDVTSFQDDILIAPACVVERGYNIVDVLGNAWFDSVMFLVRPMPDPSDYNLYVQRVNGYIINKYKDLTCMNRVEIVEDIRKDAFKHYSEVSKIRGSLSDLPDYMRTDAIAALFVTIEQVFGRLCRMGSTIKEKPPKIYFLDGAFNSNEEGKFNTFKELQKYLKYLIEDSPNPLVAKTLYEPFYQALKGEK